jgi:hypothetical protein
MGVVGPPNGPARRGGYDTQPLSSIVPSGRGSDVRGWWRRHRSVRVKMTWPPRKIPTAGTRHLKGWVV